jgi:predicted secreted protein with PEFG-CTERM motif
MKTNLLIILAIGMIGFVAIPYSYASCAAPLFGPPGPCFDSFSVFTGPRLTENSIMENYARNIELNYGEWQMSDRNWDNADAKLELPAIICTEFVADGMKQYRMAKWINANKISSWENHYNPSLCDKWLPPIDDGIKLKWDEELYPSDDIAQIQVMDKDMNLDDKKIDFFDIHVWSDTDHNGIELTITETNNDSGIFEARVFFTTKDESSGARLLVEDAVYAEHKSNVGSARIINEFETQHTTDQLNVYGSKVSDSEQKFEIWPEQSVQVLGTQIKMSGTICPSPYELFELESFYHEESSEKMYDEGFLVMHYLTKPDGTIESQMRNNYEHDCSEPLPQYFYADQLGQYKVHAVATWNSNGIQNISSNVATVTVTEPIFDYVIEPVIVDNKNWVIRGPVDWSVDGNSILFQVWVEFDSENHKNSLVMISPDGVIQKQLDFTGSPISDIDHAQIAPTNDMIHIIDEGKMYRYVLATDKIIPLNTEGNHVEFFDYYVYSEDEDDNYSIVYSVENQGFYADDLTSKYSLLVMNEQIDLNPLSVPSEFFGNIENPNFHFSPDGKKILFLKTIDAGYGWADRVPAYIEAQDHGPHVVPNVDLNCSNLMQWSPNGEMILYQDNRCGRTVNSGVFGLATLDGYHEKLIPTIDPSTKSYPSSFVVSPDGSTIVYVTSDGKSDFGESGDFYKLILAKSIPEFETIAMMIMLVSVLPIIMLRKQSVLK